MRLESVPPPATFDHVRLSPGTHLESDNFVVGSSTGGDDDSQDDKTDDGHDFDHTVARKRHRFSIWSFFFPPISQHGRVWQSEKGCERFSPEPELTAEAGDAISQGRIIMCHPMRVNLRFTVVSHSQEVEGADGDEEDGDPDGNIDVLSSWPLVERRDRMSKTRSGGDPKREPRQGRLT